MRKLTLLIAYVACSLLMWAELPFKPSTDTGDGAIWYQLNWWYEDHYVCWKAENLDGALNIEWSLPTNPSDKFQFCFIGNETDGFEIYNKAMLANTTHGKTTLTTDLKLRTIPTSGNMAVGFTSNDAPEVTKDITKWKVKADATGKYALVAADDDNWFLWRSGASAAETFKANYTWEGAFALQFYQLTKEAPFKASKNTGDDAHWYFIQWYVDDKDGFKCLTPNGFNDKLGISWGDPDFDNPEDKFLYCFVGSMANGFKIYNKAYLAGKTAGGTTLAEDMPLRELNRDSETTTEWREVGIYESAQSVEGELWLPVESGLTATDSRHWLVSYTEQQRSWNKNGASTVETGPNTVTWGNDTRKIRFIPFEKEGPTTHVAEATNRALTCIVSGNEVHVLNAGNAVINVYAINGALVRENTEPDFTLESGMYILRAGDKASKIAIK